MNVRLLRKVRKLIAEEPRRLNMGNWGIKVQNMDFEERPEDPPPCGTVACLAGWTVLASIPKQKWAGLFTETGLIPPGGSYPRDVERAAAKLLGVQEDDCPFWETEWGPDEVLGWIDRQLAAKEPK